MNTHRPPRRTWLVALVLAVAAAIVMGGLHWLESPARLRPATLPEGGRIVEERFAAGRETTRTYGRRTIIERSPDIYFMHIEATEAAFVQWMHALNIEEVVTNEGPGTREWMDPPDGRCVRTLVLFPMEDYGVFGIACR